MATLQMAPRIAPDAQTNDGGYKVAQGFREGSISVVDFIERMAAWGKYFVANMGSVVTPLTFLITAANRPDAWIRVPTGTTILPVCCDVSFTSVVGTAQQIEIRSCQNDIGNGTSSAATVGPLSTRTDQAAAAGNCTARQLATADVTAETNPLSLFRKQYILANAAGEDEKGAHITREMMKNPYLIGPASWEVYVPATTTQATGYIIMGYVETPSNWWT